MIDLADNDTVANRKDSYMAAASTPPLPEPEPDPAPDAPVQDPEPGAPPGTRIDDPAPFAPIDDPVPTTSDDEDSAPDSITTDPRRGEGLE